MDMLSMCRSQPKRTARSGQIYFQCYNDATPDRRHRQADRPVGGLAEEDIASVEVAV